MARATSVAARCAVFCNAFAPLFGERVKKVRCEKGRSARRAVFLQWLCAICCRPGRGEAHAVLFFTMVFARLGHPKWTLYNFLRAFWRPCHCRLPRLEPAWTRLGPACVAGKPPQLRRECDVRQKQEFYMRVVRFSETWLPSPALRDTINGIPLKDA